MNLERVSFVTRVYWILSDFEIGSRIRALCNCTSFPYICAEWEWGTPAWLMKEELRVRSSDSVYLQHLDEYYASLIPKLAKLQLAQGGNVLMFQVENEYGSYGEEKKYLRSVAGLMRKHGLTAPCLPRTVLGEQHYVQEH